MYVWIIWKYLIILFNKIDLNDIELLCNLSSLFNFDNIYLLRSEWINMAFIYVWHPYQYSLCWSLVIYIYLACTSYVSPIETFTSILIAPNKLPWCVGNIRPFCSSPTDIWSRWFCFFTIVPLIWWIISLLHLDIVLHDGVYISSHVFHWVDFRQENFIMSLWINQGLNTWNIRLQDETFFKITIKSILHCTYLTRKECSWLLYYICTYFSHCHIYNQHWINPFQGCQRYSLITNYIDR